MTDTAQRRAHHRPDTAHPAGHEAGPEHGPAPDGRDRAPPARTGKGKQPRARAQRRLSADYRWTVPKVRAFLDALAQSGKVAEAARSVGMSRQSAYRLRDRLSSGPYAASFELARAAGRQSRARRPSVWDGQSASVLASLSSALSSALPSVMPAGTEATQSDTMRRKVTHNAAR